MPPPSERPQPGPSRPANAALIRDLTRGWTVLQPTHGRVPDPGSARDQAQRSRNRGDRPASARRAGSAAPQRKPRRPDGAARRRALGGEPAADCGDVAPKCHRAAAEAARARRAPDAFAGLHPARRPRPLRPRAVREPPPVRARSAAGRACAAPSRGARGVARRSARGARLRVLRPVGGAPAGGAPHRGPRGPPRRRPRSRAPRRPRAGGRGARRRAPAPRAAARAADARPVQIGPPGGRPSGLPGRAAGARRGAWHRPRAGATSVARIDPAPGSRPRPHRKPQPRRGRRDPRRPRRGRRGSAVGPPRARPRVGRGRARRQARGALSLSRRRAGRPPARLAVRGGDARLRAAVRRAPRPGRGGRRAARRAPLPRLAAAASPGAGRAAPADRHDGVRPRARAGLRRGWGGGRRRLVPRLGAEPRQVLPRRAGRDGAGDRRPEHLRLRVVARPAHRDPQGARADRCEPVAGLGELRCDRGRLHRLSRSRRGRRGRARRARGDVAPEPLPLPRVHDARLVPPARPRPDVGRGARRVPRVGRSSSAGPGRARVVAACRRRPDRVAARAVYRSARGECRDPSGGSRGVSVAAEPRLAAPYRGLSPFGESDLDALLFFGRERETEIATANLIASRLTVLYGPSGVGKTSLLRAGVARRVRELGGLRAVGRGPDLACVVFSSWAGDPGRALAEAIEAEVAPLVSPIAPRPPAGVSLADVVEHWTVVLDGDLCLVLDQLEEYFVYHDAQALVEELAAVVLRPDLRANVLLSLRDDSLADLDVFKARIPTVFANSLRLDRLDRQAATAAIIGPAQQWNVLAPPNERVDIESELVDDVLAQSAVAGDATRIEAPYLQLVMERVWNEEHARGSRLLRASTLVALGGAAAIVRDHLDRALGGLDEDAQDAAALMFEHLVTPSGTKIAHRASDLAKFARLPAARAAPVLGALGRERILRPLDDTDAGGDRYEIFHDVLAHAILEWRRRREVEHERVVARRRQRRLGALLAAAVVLLLLMTGVTAYAFDQRREARTQAERALVAQDVAQKNARTAAREAVEAEKQRKRAQDARKATAKAL